MHGLISLVLRSVHGWRWKQAGGEWCCEIRKATVNFSVCERCLQNQNRIVLTKRLICVKNSSQPSEGQLSTLISKEAEGVKIRS